MGKIANEINRLQIEKNLTLPELFEKYPHLARLQLEEVLEENILQEDKKLLLG